MPSYTETFACPVCRGTATTTSTTSPPGVCPEGYEPCEGENLWNWFIPPNNGGGIPLECYWEELIPCSEGCESYPPDFTPLCEAGQEIAAPGLCCRPTTSTTESPSTSTTPPPEGWLGKYNADLICNYCQYYQSIGDQFDPYRTLNDCLAELQAIGFPICDNLEG